MTRGVFLLIAGFLLGNKGVPLLVHLIYIALIVAAYKLGSIQ